MSNKKDRPFEFDVNKVLTEDFDELPEKEARRQRWEGRHRSKA